MSSLPTSITSNTTESKRKNINWTDTETLRKIAIAGFFLNDYEIFRD